MMLSGRQTRSAALAVLLLAAAGTACDKVPLLAPTSSTITVNASTRALPLGGSTEISAVVLEQSGTPVQNGTTVTFSSSLGSVSPAEAQTRNGIATTTFNAGMTSGEAVVRANSGPAGGGTGDAATNVVRINVGAAAVAEGGVIVTASPTSVPPGGGTVSIVASAVDAGGNRITNVPVSFSTTTGTLSANSVVTDASGDARVTLTTNQAATVTARVGSRTGTAAITLAPAVSVTLTTSANPVAGLPMTLTITPVANTAATVSVNWGDGDTQDLGVVAAARSVTHVYDDPGVYAITVSATSPGDSFSTSTTVTVAPRVTVTATPTTGTTATNFSFAITPAPGSAPSNVVVNFGDGSSEVALGAITAATTVQHQYGSTGNKTVTVTQTDRNGTTTATVVVSVN